MINQQQFDTNTSLPSTLSYYGYDGHGSVRFLINTNGGITDTYTYDAFGSLIASTGSTPNNYLYCGQQWDSDLGLYYNRARYLNTDIGRFWTMDGDHGNNEDPLSLHKYLYAEDDTVDGADPTGSQDTMGELAIEAIDMCLAGFSTGVFLNPTEHRIVTGTIWFSVGIDAIVKYSYSDAAKLKREFNFLDWVLRTSCPDWGILWLGSIQDTFNWKPLAVPVTDRYWRVDTAPVSSIGGHAGGIPLILTELTIDYGAYAFTSRGVCTVMNINTCLNNTLAHEIGHFAGYSGGELDGGKHSSDPYNIMFSAEYGGNYNNAKYGDMDYCNKVTALAQ